jgi:hypothetical protein
VRVQSSVGITVSDPDSQDVTYFSRTTDTGLNSTDAFNAQSSDTFYLPDTQQPLPLPMGNVLDGWGLYIEANAAISVFLNGNTQAIMLKLAVTGGPCRMFFEGAVQSATLASATPGVSVRGRYVVWGYSPLQATP